MDRKATLSGGLYRHPKTGIIWIRFRHKRREYRRSTHERTTRRAAEAGRKIRSEIEQGEVARIARRTTLAELHLSDLAETRDRGCTDHYYKTEKSRWAVVLGNLPAGIHIDELTYDALRAYEGRRRKEGIRGQTITREIRAIKRAWRIAKRRGLVDEMPASWPRIARNPPDVSLAGKLWPVETIRDYLALLNQDARDEIEFAALTGLRITELKRAQKDWVVRAVGEVPALLVMPEAGSKTREARDVPLSAPAWAIFERRKKALKKGDTLIFSQQDYKKHRRRVCLSKTSGLGLDRVITPRDMRHTFASLLLQQSNDPVAAMRILGHRDLRTTEMYLSTNRDRLMKAAAAVSAVIVGSPNGITQEQQNSKVAE